MADWLPNVQTAQSEAFYQSFRQRYPKPADDYVHMRMQLMVEALAQAIEKAGSTDAVAVARALERARCQPGRARRGTMRAADHQFQQQLVVGVMDRQGTPGVKFDVEGSGYGFRVVKTIQPAQAEMPTTCTMVRRWLILGSSMRQAIQNLEESKIREVANAGMGRSDVLAFWFGESDEVTPDFIRQAAIESLQKGETFYAHNLGLPELREAVAQLHQRLHGTVASDRIAITSGGVNALMLAVQALVDAGDEVVAVTPVWPNLTAQPLIMGAKLQARVAASPRAAPGRWTCRRCWTPSRRRPGC